MLISLLALLSPQTPAPEGARLPDYDACYTISRTRDGVSQPIGVAWQTVEHGRRDGRPVVLVTVHQSIANGAFDMRDDFVLDGSTLRPLSLLNRRNGQTHVELSYEEGRVRGSRTEEGRTSSINVPLPSPVFEGNLYGVTFAALPLSEGARFTLPYWQYDKGFGEFHLHVAGSETVETPEGPAEAWVVTASAEPARELTYYIGKSDRRELGYRAPQGGQFLGGDCSAISQSQGRGD